MKRKLYIKGNICGFLFYMATKIETARSGNGTVLAEMSYTLRYVDH